MTDATQHFTHHVALVLDNDQEAYNRRRAIVREWFGEGADARSLAKLADTLKDWARELVEPLYAGSMDRGGGEWTETGVMLARELLSSALDFADWRRLAIDWAEEDAPAELTFSDAERDAVELWESVELSDAIGEWLADGPELAEREAYAALSPVLSYATGTPSSATYTAPDGVVWTLTGALARRWPWSDAEGSA